MKLTKLEQEKLNTLSEQKKHLKVALRMLSEDVGKAEVNFWAFVEELSGGKEVHSVEHSGKNAKIVFKE